MFKSIIAAVAVTLGIASTTHAAHQYVNFPELVHTSHVIVDARVSAISVWSDDFGMIHTAVDLQVLELMHADEAATQPMNGRMKLQLPGGRVGDRVVTVSGTPGFQIGERVVLFALHDGATYWSPILGGDQGVFRVLDRGPGLSPLPMRTSGRGIMSIDDNRISNSPIVDSFDGEEAVFTQISDQHSAPPTGSEPNIARTRVELERGTLMTLETFKAHILDTLATDPQPWDISLRLEAAADAAATQVMAMQVDNEPSGSTHTEQARQAPSQPALDVLANLGLRTQPRSRGSSNLCVCSSHELFLTMQMVPDDWWVHEHDNWAMWCWNQYMDIYRINDYDGGVGPSNGENEFGAFQSNDWLSNAGYTYTWGATTLGVTITWSGGDCDLEGLVESDVFFNPGYTWTDQFDTWFNANYNPAPYQPTTAHEIGHTFGFIMGGSSGGGWGCSETYDYNRLSVMHSLYDSIVEDGHGIHSGDAWAIRTLYDDQTDIIDIVDVGCESYFSNNGTLSNATTNATSYIAGDSITFQDITIENMSNQDVEGLNIRFYLSSDRTITTGDTQIGGSVGWATFGAEGWWTGDVTRTLPSSLWQGTYFLGMIVTTGGNDFTLDDKWFNNATSFATTIEIRPENDLCSNAQSISTGNQGFDTTFAITDGLSDITCGGGQIYSDVWYRYTPSCDGSVSLDVCTDTDFDTVLAVYLDVGNCAPTANWLVACNDDLCFLQSGVDFSVDAGQDYLIRIGGYDSNSEGPGVLHLSKTDTMINDTCQTALTANNGTWIVNTDCAQTDGAADADCGYTDMIYNDVWYRYTASCPGVLHVNTCGVGGVDTVLAMYDATNGCGALDLLDCNDQSPTCSDYPNSSTLFVPVTMGQTVLVRLGGWTSTQAGDIQLTFHLFEGAANDDCVDAQSIASGVHEFDTRCASTDGLPHDDCQWNGQTYNDVWFEWTAPCTGELTVSTCDIADFDTDLVLYHTGGTCPPGDNDLIACNDDGDGCSGYTSELSAIVVSGESYLIRVGGYGSTDSGAGTVSVKCEPECVGDVDDSGTVDIEDLLMILGAYGGSDAASDVNGDGIVDINDLLLVISTWGPCN